MAAPGALKNNGYKDFLKVPGGLGADEQMLGCPCFEGTM